MEIIKNNALKENILDIKIDSSTNLSTLVSTILLATHPVGSLYWSSDSTDPGTLFGGTWTQITDTYIVAAGSSFTVGNNYGALTHKHTTGNHTLTADESGLPSHQHNYVLGTWDDGNWTGYRDAQNPPSDGPGSYTPGNKVAAAGGTAAVSAHNHGDTGDASSLPPSIARYCWERTA